LKSLTGPAGDPKHLGAKIGITSVLHTWGSVRIEEKKTRIKLASAIREERQCLRTVGAWPALSH
jgi:hypothetical protein